VPQSEMVGTRIRERRILAGIKQADLAGRAGISPSYLNLIEHNRRKVAGKTLLTLAEVLGVEPSVLSEGAEARLIAGLREASGAQAGHAAELDRLEEFAGRFPGWARLLVDISARLAVMEQAVQTLTDRMSHDPHLAASLHEVISTVTSIRSTASILAEEKDLEPEWRARFDRNINEDSRRLAEGATALVRYLENAPDTEAGIQSPQDELHAFLGAEGYHFPTLEAPESSGSAEADLIEAILAEAPALSSDSARQLARDWLQEYAQDARALPLPVVEAVLRKYGMRPEQILTALDAMPGNVLRRLASLPEDMVGPVGLVSCDTSGTILLRKPLPGFAIPRAAGACPLWPLYQVLGQPNLAVAAELVQSGRTEDRVQSFALAEQVVPPRFGMAAQMRAFMLLLPANPGGNTTAARQVGSTCRICPREGCVARREPSIVAKVF